MQVSKHSFLHSSPLILLVHSMALMAVPVALVVHVWRRAHYISALITLTILCLTAMPIVTVTMDGIYKNLFHW